VVVVLIGLLIDFVHVFAFWLRLALLFHVHRLTLLVLVFGLLLWHFFFAENALVFISFIG
jgi:hypothetical protein